MMRGATEFATRIGLGIAGVGLFLVLWQLIGVFRIAGLTWPPLTTVLAFMADPGRQPLLLRAMSASYSAVALGYVSGIAVGLGAAVLGHLAQPLRPGIDHLVAVIHAVPPIALAPVFMTLLSRDSVPSVLSALGVAYMIYVSASSGLEAAGQVHRDLFRVLGASPWTRVWRLYLPCALPALASGLKLAVPIAFIGGIIGEWFGASRGLGLLMVSGMQNFQIPLLWSAVFIATATSLVLFALMSLIERLVVERFR